MSRKSLVVVLGCCAWGIADVTTLLAQGAYPRVVSPTGRFYGPTQAHYQYERQYGQPWWGGPAQYNPNTGATINVSHPHGGHHHHGGYGPGWGYGGFYVGTTPFAAYGYSQQGLGFGLSGLGGALYGYSGYNGYLNQVNVGIAPPAYYAGPQPVPYGMPYAPQYQYTWRQLYQQQLMQQQLPNGQFPRDPLPPPPGEPLLGRAPQPNGGGVFQAPRNPLVNVQPVGPEEPIVTRGQQLLPPQPSSLEQKARSVHFIGQGDIWFRQQNYLQAYSRYKQAATAASDLAAPRFRMAYALIALKRYDVAVSEMARGILLDPAYPLKGESPAKVMGPENQIAAGALPGQVADWAKQDIRSVDRLFLLGALLRMTGDIQRARICFEAAAQLGNQPAAVMAFLNLDEPSGAKPSPAPAPADQDRSPVPEAVEELLRDTGNLSRGGPVNTRPGDSRPVPGLAAPGVAAPVFPGPADEGTGGPSVPPVNRDTPPALGPARPSPGLPSPNAPGTTRPEMIPDDDDSPLPPVPRSGGKQAESKIEPALGIVPAKSKATDRGFQPIPKKGSAAERLSSPPALIDPATPEKPAGKPVEKPAIEGPVLPVPQSGN